MRKLHRGAPVKDFRPDGRGSEFIVGANGELNANSKIELIHQQQRLAAEVASGRVLTLDGERLVETAEEKKESFAELAAAYRDPSSNKFKEIGQMLSSTLQESIERQGFMRRVLFKGELSQGNIPRHRVKRVNTTAQMATGASAITPTFVRDNYIMPPEFNIPCSILITNKELNQGSADLLDEKFYEGQRQVMVVEDALMIRMAKANTADNPIIYISGSYTPQAIGQIRGQVTEWGHSPMLALAAADVLTDMISSPTFTNYFDPVSRYDIIMSGTLGNLHGTEIVTDQFRDLKLKVLNRGDFIVFGPSDYVGAYTERGPLESVPVDGRIVHGTPARGWFMNEDLSMTIHSGRSISRGSR